MKYECDNNAHIYLDGARVCVCTKGPVLSEKPAFKGTMGELEQLLEIEKLAGL